MINEVAEPLFLGLDLGTTNAKAAAYDGRGAVVATGVAAYPTSYPQPGWAEQRPADWVTALTTANTLVQLSVDPAMRGRVMALYMAIFLGGTPIGAPLIGRLGDWAGPRWTIGVGSVAVGLSVVIVGSWLVKRENVDMLIRKRGRR